jgi:hypothetical protein
VPELGEKLRPPIEAALEPGEELRGICIATQASLFKGRLVGIGVTDGRLIVQPLTRRFEPDGDAISLSPGRIVDASADGAGRGWPDIGAALMDRAAVTLKLRTADGVKLKLAMMRGTGPLGGLGGGETQRHGVDAIGQWFARQAGRR